MRVAHKMLVLGKNRMAHTAVMMPKQSNAMTDRRRVGRAESLVRLIKTLSHQPRSPSPPPRIISLRPPDSGVNNNMNDSRQNRIVMASPSSDRMTRTAGWSIRFASEFDTGPNARVKWSREAAST